MCSLPVDDHPLGQRLLTTRPLEDPGGGVRGRRYPGGKRRRERRGRLPVVDGGHCHSSRSLVDTGEDRSPVLRTSSGPSGRSDVRPGPVHTGTGQGRTDSEMDGSRTLYPKGTGN